MRKHNNMEDNLDKKLKDRIREVFDNYDDASADTGWQLLRERFPEEKKQRIIPLWWWYSGAAVLLLALGLWFFKPSTVNDQNIVKNNHPHTAHQSSATIQAGTGVSVPAQTSASLKENPAPESPGQLAQIKPGKQEIRRSSVHIKSTPHPAATYSYSLSTPDNKEVHAAVSKPRMKDAPNGSQNNNNNGSAHPETSNNIEVIAGSPLVENKVADLKQSAEAQTNSSSQADTKQKSNDPTSAGAKKDAVMKMIMEDQARQAAISKKQGTQELKKNKSVIFGVYAATYVNYAKGSTSDFNVGAGFTSDFKLGGNFRLSTGLSIAQNSLNYTNGVNVPQQITNQVAASVASNYGALAPSSTIYPLTSPAVKNSNANLIGLDIPLNIKYQLNPRKNDTYIMAGISSGTFIDETYRSTFGYVGTSVSAFNGITSTVATENQQSVVHQHFNTFDLAHTLNLSFGTGYKLGKYNRLIIEPFLKYPLSGLGSQDLRFGAGGVNLKLNFDNTHK